MINKELQNSAADGAANDASVSDVQTGEKHTFSPVSFDTGVDTGFFEWQVIPSFPMYEASNTGLIRRSVPGQRTRAGRIVKPMIDKYGYMRVTIMRGGKSVVKLVHVLVAEAFIGLRPKEMTVDHLDADKRNNHVTNLEYVSRGENIRRAHHRGAYRRGEAQLSAKLTDEKVRQIKSQLPEMSNCALGRQYGVSDVAIRKIRLGMTWQHVPACLS